MSGISFIIPFYNTNIKYFKKCIFSVVKQCHLNDEIIIINDGSKKNIFKFLKYLKKKIILIHNKSNVGISKSRNIGILNSNKPYISFIDSDDFVSPEKISKIRKFINENKYDVISTNFNLIYNSRATIKEKKDKKYKTETVWAYFFKKEFIKKNEIFFHDKILKNEDQLFMSQIFSNSPKYVKIKTNWYNYRIHENNISYNNSVSKFKCFTGNIEILHSLFNIYKKKRNKFVLSMILDNIQTFFESIYLFERDSKLKEYKTKNILKNINLLLKTNFTYKKIRLIYEKFYMSLNLKNKTNILVYCAYDCSFPFLSFLKKKNIYVNNILDSNKSIEKKKFESLSICHPSKINKITFRNRTNLIFVTHPQKKTFLNIKKNLLFLSNNKIIIKHIGFNNIFT